MGGGVFGEGGIHGACAAGEPGEVAVAEGELFGGFFGAFALDGVAVERKGEACAVGPRFAVNEERFGGGAHHFYQHLHLA